MDAPVSVARAGILGRAREAIGHRSAITANGLVLVLVAVAGWAVARMTGSRALYLLSYSATLIVLAAWWVSRRRMSLSAERSSIPMRMREGQSFDVEISLTTKRRLHTTVLTEEVHPHLGQTARKLVAAIAPGDPLKIAYELRPTLRGVYAVGPLVATWSDPFGLTRRRLQLLERLDVIVHPATEDAQARILTRQWEDPPVRPPLSRPWPTGQEFYGMREYAPGDDMRRVVWSASARAGRVLVRESEQGITDRIQLVLDTSRAHHTPGDPSASFEAAVRAIASLGVRHLRDGLSVLCDGNAARICPPLRGGTAHLTLLDGLARVQRESASLEDALGRLLLGMRRDVHMFIVTPELGAKAATALKILTDRGVGVTVVAVAEDAASHLTLARAASLGCQVAEVRPGAPLSVAFRREVGAGR